MLEVARAFPTLIGRLPIPDADAMNLELKTLIISEEMEYLSLGRCNIGGWHAHPDLLKWPKPAIATLRDWVGWALRRMIGAAIGEDAYDSELSTAAWTTICRSGRTSAPHCHPDSAWSGVYYVDPCNSNPEHPFSGVLEFLDPRPGVEAVTAPGDPVSLSALFRDPVCWLYFPVGCTTGSTRTPAGNRGSLFRSTPCRLRLRRSMPPGPPSGLTRRARKVFDAARSLDTIQLVNQKANPGSAGTP